MKIQDIINRLEAFAPPAYQEGYDNAGLITGNREAELKGLLVCLDCTEEILEEARRKNCNLVVAHHPIVFSGLRRLTGDHYVERVVMQSIRHDIAIYAVHTNMDNVMHGVNDRICDMLELDDRRVMRPMKGQLKKLAVFCPLDSAEKVRSAMFTAGAGHIGNYDECSFNLAGTGTFKGGEGSKPHVGKRGSRHEEKEVRVEVVVPAVKVNAVIHASKTVHPYEEPAIDIYPLDNDFMGAGAGMIGSLPAAMGEEEVLRLIKKVFRAGCVRHTRLLGKPVRKVAVCGGSGSFLLDDAIRMGAGLFLSADFKYHQFFDADGRILVADAGHFESEQFTIDLLGQWVTDKMPKFALHLAETNTNPVYYI